MHLTDHGVGVGRRDRKKHQTRTALMMAALRLVAARGLEAVTVDDISEAADVSPRTFFNYFSSKDDALTADQLLDGAAVRERVAAMPAEIPALGAIRLAFAPMIDNIQLNQELWFLRIQVLSRNPALLPRLLAGSVEAERAMTAVIASRTGTDPDTDTYPLLITAVTGAAFRSALSRWVATDGARPLADLVDEAFAIVAAGLPDPSTTRLFMRTR